MWRKYFGDRAFYKSVLAVAIPIMIQNFITHFVNMLDNVMVGSIGVSETTGTAIANQLLFVFNLCIFGAVAGAGIFGAQFHGKGDSIGVRDTFRFKLVFCTVLCLIGMTVLGVFDDTLIQLYLKGEGEAVDAAAALGFAKEYLAIMLVGLLPFTLSQCYGSTLRETGKTVPPMVAGMIAVGVNLCLNYVLIFGHFGAPKLGVVGAAIATVISRFVELAIIAIWTHTHAETNPFIRGAYRSLRVPRRLIGQIIRQGLPLMLNETLWAGGLSVVTQCYSLRSLEVVAASNISQTFFNVFSVAFLAIGLAIGIIVGQMLGAGEFDKARESVTRLAVLAVLVGIVAAAVYLGIAHLAPLLYNVGDEVREMATRLMQITALVMPLDAYVTASYFTLRSGGRTGITFLFDSGFVWLGNVPLAFVLVHVTDLPILAIYAIVQALFIIKAVIGGILLHGGVWVRNIVNHPKGVTEE